MEFWKPDNLKAEQSTAMRMFSYKVRKMLKLLEIMSALILVFWSTTRLPIAVKLVAEFAKQSGALLLSTPSVFLIGNAIVVALVAQSGTFQSSPDPRTDLYEEFVTESRRRTQIHNHEVDAVSSETAAPEKVVSLPDTSATEDVGGLEVSKMSCYRRTQSEMVVGFNVRKELRRSRTENLRMKMKTPPAEAAVDDLSGDEFRRTVEAFIAKQQRFLRDENMAVVLSN